MVDWPKKFCYMVCLFSVNIISKMLFLEFQLRLCKGISYAAVAAHADKNGRRKLAAMLVEHEPRSSKQVCNFFPSISKCLLNKGLFIAIKCSVYWLKFIL